MTKALLHHIAHPMESLWFAELGLLPPHELVTLVRDGEPRWVRPGPHAHACGRVWSITLKSLGAGAGALLWWADGAELTEAMPFSSVRAGG